MVSHDARPEHRLVSAAELRAAYLRYEESLAPEAPPFVEVPEHDMELGIVSSAVPSIARAVSSMLRLSLDDARHDRGGHLPPAVVGRVQAEIISPEGVAGLWGTTGHRFVLSRPAGAERRELVATILVARSKDTIFFFTGRYHNLRHSALERDVDFEQPDEPGGDPARRWFDRFDFPPLARMKPLAYHHIANFVVAKELRGHGYGRLLLDTIVRCYARDHLVREGEPIGHSQHLLCGRGFWQIGDPPWRVRMDAHGFYVRWGAESFFVERPWAPLPPVLSGDKAIPHVEYNRSHGLPALYTEGLEPHPSHEHLFDRVPHVLRLAADERHKLQYFQMMRDFV